MADPNFWNILPSTIEVPLLIELKYARQKKKDFELLQAAPINFSDSNNKFGEISTYQSSYIPAWFFKGDPNRTALHWGVLCNLTKFVETLLSDPEFDINAQDAKGLTALMWAALLDRTHAAKLLLLHKADFKMQNKSGKTCLDLCDNTFIDRMLLLSGEDADLYRKKFQRIRQKEMKRAFFFPEDFQPKLPISIKAERFKQLQHIKPEEIDDVLDLSLIFPRHIKPLLPLKQKVKEMLEQEATKKNNPPTAAEKKE